MAFLDGESLSANDFFGDLKDLLVRLGVLEILESSPLSICELFAIPLSKKRLLLLSTVSLSSRSSFLLAFFEFIKGDAAPKNYVKILERKWFQIGSYGLLIKT